MLRVDDILHGARDNGVVLGRGLLLKLTLLLLRREAPNEGAKPCEPARQLKAATSETLCLGMLLRLLSARRMLAVGACIRCKCDTPDFGFA
jgi:hypothetical protein